MCLAVSGRILAIYQQPPQAAESSQRAGLAGADALPASPASATDTATTAASTAGGDPLWRVADVDFGGVRQQVSLACLPEARAGDQVLVHVGIALALVHDPDPNPPTAG